MRAQKRVREREKKENTSPTLLLLPVHVAQHLQPLPVVDRDPRHQPYPPLYRVHDGVGPDVEEGPGRSSDFRGEADPSLGVDDGRDLELRPGLFDEVVAFVLGEEVFQDEGARGPGEQALLSSPRVQGRVRPLFFQGGFPDSRRGLGGCQGALGCRLARGDGLRGVELEVGLGGVVRGLLLLRLCRGRS